MTSSRLSLFLRLFSFVFLFFFLSGGLASAWWSCEMEPRSTAVELHAYKDGKDGTTQRRESPGKECVSYIYKRRLPKGSAPQFRPPFQTCISQRGNDQRRPSPRVPHPTSCPRFLYSPSISLMRENQKQGVSGGGKGARAAVYDRAHPEIPSS